MLSTSVALAYSELAHLYAVRDTADAALAVRTRSTELIAGRNRAELETLGNVRQMEARQAAAQTELLAIDERIALQKNALAALVGAGPDRGLAIERPTAMFRGGFGLPPVLAVDLLGRRPDIAAARLRTEATAKRVDAQKAGFYPSVNLLGFVGAHSLGLDNLTDSDSSVGSVGLAVSLPIFNTRNLQGQLRGARAEYDMAVANYNGTLIRALREVADVAASRRALDAQLDSQRASVAAATEAHRIVSDRYRGELSTYLDVLSAEDALLSSQRVLADLETRALFLDIALTRALGGGYRAESTVAVAATNQPITPNEEE
jgi:NodT family efflux transporter outer membrane factor (OMF) lipoprotein